MHPFDVGDRVEVDGVQVMSYRQSRFIIITVARKCKTQLISAFTFRLREDCTHEGKDLEYIDNKTEHWQPAPLIIMRDAEDMNRIKFSMWPNHRMNHQYMGERWVRRALLVEEMVKTFRELDIEYRLLPLDVNVRNMPSISSTRLPSNWSTCAP
ncbi:hypothetical protein CASFOL_016012 [Castilleja foliolosa]|uniref:Uncharacterized protein n=1 Tax=Castilleja foliolosa TaxID=1961234 RepID=A0ABD3DIV7_9LAMI